MRSDTGTMQLPAQRYPGQYFGRCGVDAETIADALDLKRNGKGWRGPCPVCGGSDKSNKFSLKDGDNGPLVYCFSGCTFESISSELRSRGLWSEATSYQCEQARRKNSARDIDHAETVLFLAESAKKTGRELSAEDQEIVSQSRDKVAIAAPSAGFVDTDMANAERFARLHADVVFHTPECGWLIYDGKRWCIDEQGQVMRLAKQTARKIFSELEHAQNAQEKELFKWARQSQSKDRLNAMLALAQSEPGICWRDI